jgi:hypothetical protein
MMSVEDGRRNSLPTFPTMVRPFRLAIASTFKTLRKADAMARRKGLTKGGKNVTPTLDAYTAS